LNIVLIDLSILFSEVTGNCVVVVVVVVNSSNSSSKIRSFFKIFLGTFENAALGVLVVRPVIAGSGDAFTDDTVCTGASLQLVLLPHYPVVLKYPHLLSVYNGH